ncbi:MAG: hypothetical protein Q7J16_10105 [Candidatus Cloacimonadales bacterium]|nr:hypothetical protein [Candidatus Cloacimonadales bacterium]
MKEVKIELLALPLYQRGNVEKQEENRRFLIPLIPLPRKAVF